MTDRWDPALVHRLARLAGLTLGPQEALVLAAALRETADLLDRLPPQPSGAGQEEEPAVGPVTCPLREDEVTPPPAPAWPPAAPRDEAGLLILPPVVRREDDDV